MKSIQWIVMVLVCLSNLNAKTIIAGSCNRDSVQAACDRAGNGDTVKVPAGTVTYKTTGVYILNKSLSIFGAFQYSDDSTVIFDSTDGVWEHAPFWFELAANRPAIIGGFTFKGAGSSSGAIVIHSSLPTVAKGNLIFSCKWYNCPYRGISIIGFVYGLVCHCTFTRTLGGTSFQGVGITGDADASWNRTLTLGDSNAVFIEDCEFNFNTLNGGNAIDQYQGARVVFRYNNVYNSFVGNHGSCANRGDLAFEIYNNTVQTNASLFRAFHIRGGTGVIYNNTIKGPYTFGISLDDYKTCSGMPNASTCTPPMTRCNGGDPLDGNTPDSLGWPCLDQVGRGPNQSSMPLYQWNNTFNSKICTCSVSNSITSCINPSVADHIKKNRDYFDNVPKPGYKVPAYPYPHPLTKLILIKKGGNPNEVGPCK